MARSDPGLTPAATYEKNLAAGRLTYQRCGECLSAVFYPRLSCPACGGIDLSWQDSAGQGVVYTLSAIPQKDSPDHVVCLVDLDEGFRMMSTISPEAGVECAIGSRVSARIEPGGQADAEGPRVVFFASERHLPVMCSAR